jgi:hypothetical protein
MRRQAVSSAAYEHPAGAFARGLQAQDGFYFSSTTISAHAPRSSMCAWAGGA